MKIIIWTGPAWETWGESSLLTGIGGSEAAAVYLSRELAQLGHEVEVVGQVGSSATQYGLDGSLRFVDWREYAEYGFSAGPGGLRREGRRMECDVFVASRVLPAADACRPDARLRLLWSHDAHLGPDPYHLMKAYDGIFCLSRWALELARSFYPHVDPDRFIQTRNGIPVDLYRPEPVKDGFKVVYSSSADRGLDRLLDYWPEVKRIIPDAELHVYYGFETWEKMACLHADAVAAAQIQIFRQRLVGMEGLGVVSHGRVGQAELARAWLGASAWLYPTAFAETSCITAMEAQAAGTHCVCTALAALPETARYAQLVEAPSSRDGYREDFMGCVENVSRLPYLHPHVFKDRVAEGREWALRELGWDGVARQWDELFRWRL